MSDGLQQKLWVIFQSEAREHLECIRRHVQMLAGTPGLRGSTLDEAFRRAHSLKGAARAVGLSPIEMLSHRLETLFSRVREGVMLLDAPVSVTIGRVLDAIEDDMAARVQGKTPGESQEALKSMDQLLTPSAVPVAPVAPVERPLAPPAEMPREKIAGAADETVRIHTRHLDRLRSLSGELLTEGIRQQETRHQLRQMGSSVAALAKQWDRVKRGLKNVHGASDLASEPLHVFEQQLRQLGRQARQIQQTPHSGAWIFGRLGDQLQEEVHEISKVPAESLFHGFRKMVRDLARDENKDVECQVIGLDTEADRRVLQALKDPVMHLLRNALSHGIEKPGDRLKAGKKAAGLIVLRLETVGNRLQVSIEDDGRGLDWKEIAQAGVRKGLLAAGKADAAGPADLAALLFLPGFSTASTITNLSGRGMGLSIVREEVLRLQGDVQVAARDGGGTAFRISVPLSNVTHRLLLVRVKDQTLAIPVHAIDRLMRVSLSEIEQVKGNPNVKIEGQPIPLYPLAHLLKMSDISLHLEGQKIPVLVLKDSSQRLALAVDSFVNELEGVVVDFGSAFSPLRALMGGLVVSDGSVVCVLNPAELLRWGVEQVAGPHLTVEKRAPQKKTPHILVVDDSITTRTLEKGILEAHGFNVRLAVDGLDALEKLKSEKADLAIVDVEMPRMDGFSLVEQMKRDPAFSKIPVVMVTSLEAKKDKERGLAAGAEAYIVKGKFDHQNLLETIHQLI